MTAFPTEDVTDLLERISDLEIERDFFKDLANNCRGLYELEGHLLDALTDKVKEEVR
jgi:hypothetical protein